MHCATPYRPTTTSDASMHRTWSKASPGLHRKLTARLAAPLSSRASIGDGRGRAYSRHLRVRPWQPSIEEGNRPDHAAMVVVREAIGSVGARPPAVIGAIYFWGLSCLHEGRIGRQRGRCKKPTSSSAATDRRRGGGFDRALCPVWRSGTAANHVPPIGLHAVGRRVVT